MLNEKRTRCYAILPWLSLSSCMIERDDRQRNQNIATSISRCYSRQFTRYVFDDFFLTMDYYDQLGSRCDLTIHGLEHFLGFRLHTR